MPKAAAALQRCFWSDGSELYDGYHDREWGRPVIDDVRLFEKISLEGFQAGLSWITILKNHLRQFALRRRAPGAPDIHVGLAKRVERQRITDARLVHRHVDAECGGGICIVQTGHQVQQYRRTRLRRQAGNTRQACRGGIGRRFAQRGRGQQQSPVLARPFGERPLPGLAGEHPRDHRLCMPGRGLVARLNASKQASAAVESAQERRHCRRQRGIGRDGDHGQVTGTRHLSRAALRKPPEIPLDRSRAGGSASNGAGCGQISCAQPSGNCHLPGFHAVTTRMERRVSRPSD